MVTDGFSAVPGRGADSKMEVMEVTTDKQGGARTLWEQARARPQPPASLNLVAGLPGAGGDQEAAWLMLATLFEKH